MKKALLAMVFGSALVLGACGGNNDKDNNAADNNTTTETTEDTTNETNNETTTEETSKVDAEAVAQNTCIGCHGGDLSGGMGPDLTKVGSKLSEDQIKEVLQKGKGQMPAQTSLSEEEVVAVAKWLSEKK